MMQKKRVVLGMSGGVDSSLSAALLQEHGFEVTGLCLAVPYAASPVEKAKRAAEALHIPLIVKDVREAFIPRVIDRFVSEYRSGRTPNPCVFCNPAVKFAALRDAADDIGAGCIATGHYARVFEKGGRFLLRRAADRRKDQSYMLYRLPQDILSRVVFPLEEMTKPEVRVLAGERGLESAETPDSQEICFVPDGAYSEFIRSYIGEELREGDFIDVSGKVLGRHKGITQYTVGQRKGLGISLGTPAFVTAINPANNTVTLSTSEADLFKTKIEVTDLVWIPFDGLTGEMRITAKVRHTTHETPGVISPVGGGKILVRFDEPVRAPAPGQSCVFYDGETVVGGGYII